MVRICAVAGAIERNHASRSGCTARTNSGPVLHSLVISQGESRIEDRLSPQSAANGCLFVHVKVKAHGFRHTTDPPHERNVRYIDVFSADRRTAMYLIHFASLGGSTFRHFNISTQRALHNS